MNRLLSEVAKRGLTQGRTRSAIDETGFAEHVLARRVERVKAFDDRSATAAHLVPLHDDQAGLACVQKQVDDVGLVAPMLGRILDRVDAQNRIVRAVRAKRSSSRIKSSWFG